MNADKKRPDSRKAIRPDLHTEQTKTLLSVGREIVLVCPSLSEGKEHDEREDKHEEVHRTNYHASDDAHSLGHVEEEDRDDLYFVPDKGYDDGDPEKYGGNKGRDDELGVEFLVNPYCNRKHYN